MGTQKKIENTIAFLEQYLQKLTDAVTGEGKQIVMVEDLNALTQYCKKIIALFDALEKDKQLVTRLNSIAQPTSNSVSQLSVRQFFVNDCILLFEDLKNFHSEKSLFVMAFLLDALLLNHFSDELAINKINKIIVQTDFKEHIIKLIQKNKIYTNGLTLTSATNIKSADKESIEKALVYFMHSVACNKPDPNAIEQIFSQRLNDYKERSNEKSIDANDTLEKVMSELDAMIGMETVKREVKSLVNLLAIQKRRQKEGLKNPDTSLHIAFLGPPGTGKTSVARLLGRIYKHLGFIDKGHVVETDREGMVAGYVGQTAMKVDDLIEQSLEGVLFIDEAYSLAQDVATGDYGREAIDALIKRMEDKRKDIAVILAGYTEPMRVLIESNPGLRSRINRFFQFDHFTSEQLLAIFKLFCKNADFELAVEAEEKLADTFDLLYKKRDEAFGNARVVRNLFEKCVQMHAGRIVNMPNPAIQDLKLILDCDIPEPNETVKQVFI